MTLDIFIWTQDCYDVLKCPLFVFHKRDQKIKVQATFSPEVTGRDGPTEHI